LGQSETLNAEDLHRQSTLTLSEMPNDRKCRARVSLDELPLALKLPRASGGKAEFSSQADAMMRSEE